MRYVFTGSLYFCANTNGITSTPFLAHNHIAGSIVLGIELRQASRAVTCLQLHPFKADE
jgi:hypothetical protein